MSCEGSYWDVHLRETSTETDTASRQQLPMSKLEINVFFHISHVSCFTTIHLRHTYMLYFYMMLTMICVDLVF